MRARTPAGHFIRRHAPFTWEQGHGQFFEQISMFTAAQYWTRIVPAVEDRGALAIMRYKTTLGVVGSAWILRDVMQARVHGWRQYPIVMDRIDWLVAGVPMPSGSLPLGPWPLTTQMQNSSHLAGTLAELNQRTGIALINRRGAGLCAALFGVTTLARFWKETSNGPASAWATATFDWYSGQVQDSLTPKD